MLLWMEWWLNKENVATSDLEGLSAPRTSHLEWTFNSSDSPVFGFKKWNSDTIFTKCSYYVGDATAEMSEIERRLCTVSLKQLLVLEQQEDRQGAALELNNRIILSTRLSWTWTQKKKQIKKLWSVLPLKHKLTLKMEMFCFRHLISILGNLLILCLSVSCDMLA